MNQLIPLAETKIAGERQQCVNARDVHAFLGVNSPFDKWIRRRVEKFGCVEGVDFVIFDKKDENSGRGRSLKEYAVTISMAKELSMVENTTKGREARQYFLACEAELKKRQRQELRQQERRASLEWQSARREGKLVRSETCAAIERFVNYARGQGSRHAETYFMSLTRLPYRALFGVNHGPGLRDRLQANDLRDLAAAEGVITNALEQSMARGLAYRDVYRLARDRAETLARALGREPFKDLLDAAAKAGAIPVGGQLRLPMH